MGQGVEKLERCLAPCLIQLRCQTDGGFLLASGECDLLDVDQRQAVHLALTERPAVARRLRAPFLWPAGKGIQRKRRQRRREETIDCRLETIDRKTGKNSRQAAKDAKKKDVNASDATAAKARKRDLL